MRDSHKGEQNRSADSDDDEFADFIGQLADGDSVAINDILEKYSQQLLRLANKNIHPLLLKRFDGQDVVQSVFRTFFRRQKTGKLLVNGSEQLWNLLVRITLCKTRSQARRHTAKRRAVQAEKKLEPQLPDAISEASPEEALALWEEIDKVLLGLPSQTPEILNGRLEGKSKAEIAEELDLSRQTVYRILKLLEERLNARLQRIIRSSQ